MKGQNIDERARMEGSARKKWLRWGPYLSERQWGTVREDYSETGNAWDYFTHDQARSRAYRWGEDGIAGICDDKQRLCFALALWNGKDAIFKERLFGLSNGEGNHGEDVKEYYFYLDSTPTHSYMNYLYKYPQEEYPYNDLVWTNRKRTRDDFEYELLDTGIFDQDRYFDIFVEYAKASPEDVLIQITIWNRGPQAAALHILPSLWFRNTWSWAGGTARPILGQAKGTNGVSAIMARHEEVGERFLYCQGRPELLFTENETNNERLFGRPNRTAYVKDAFDNYLIHGRKEAVNPAKTGTKAAAHYTVMVPAKGKEVLQLRLSDIAPQDLSHVYHEAKGDPFGYHFNETMRIRLQEADEFYQSITPPAVGEEGARIVRQALAGMFWTKQYYYFDADL